jgi:hypothetical protein
MVRGVAVLVPIGPGIIVGVGVFSGKLPGVIGPGITVGVGVFSVKLPGVEQPVSRLIIIKVTIPLMIVFLIIFPPSNHLSQILYHLNKSG